MSDRNILSSPMQILSLRCYCDHLCHAALDKNAQCSLALICRRNILQYIPRIVLHLATHTFHAHPHPHTPHTHSRIAFMQSSSVMLGTSQGRGLFRDQSCHSSGNPFYTLCVHARPQSRPNLIIHQWLTCYPLTPPFPSLHIVITTMARPLPKMYK